MSELDPVPEPEPAKVRGRLTAFFALLVALISAGMSGYLYYRLEWDTTTVSPTDDLSEVRSALAAADERGRTLDERVSAIEGALVPGAGPEASAAGGTLDDRFAAERAHIDTSIESLREALGTALETAPPTTAEWKLAEAEYLLRIGNHRVLMERDVRGAGAMFRAADEVIKELDDIGLLPVRAALAEEIAALESVSRVDVDGAFVRIDALKKHISDLPLRLPEYTAERNAAPAPVAGTEAKPVLSRIAERLGSLIRIREHSSEGLMPLLDPVQAGFLEMNLELALERAQLALMRDDATFYRSSLESARRLLDDHLDAGSDTVAAFRAELDSLKELALGTALPDVSRSLRLLRATSRATPPGRQPGEEGRQPGEEGRQPGEEGREEPGKDLREPGNDDREPGNDDREEPLTQIDAS